MMTQSEGPKSPQDSPKDDGWWANSMTAIRKWLDVVLLNNSIVVYRVEDPYAEKGPDEHRPSAKPQQRARYSSGELRL